MLSKIVKKYHLNLGEYKFSPVIQASIGISMSYIESINDEKVNNPFLFCFPDKKNAAVWLSVGILTNYFLEDYIYTDNQQFIDFLQNGDMVEYHGAVVKIVSRSNEEIRVRFKKGTEIKIAKKFFSYLNKTNKTALNTFSYYQGQKNKRKNDRNAISKILESEEDIIINKNRLKSKVLLIAGRGDTGILRKILAETKIYKESLSDVFLEGGNLILRPTLEPYKEIAIQKQELQDFIDHLKKLISHKKISQELRDELYLLYSLIEKSGIITSDIEDMFFSIVETQGSDNFSKNSLHFLKDRFPGGQDVLSENLRAVIINDLDQLYDYKNTIEAFLKKKIPIILISDRVINDRNHLTYYKNLIETFPNLLRLNWDRNKINFLLKSNQKIYKIYIDADLWNMCYRFASQKIRLEVYPDYSSLDEKMLKLQKTIKQLDGFEVLKKAYYDFLYPALYLLKNSKSESPVIDEILEGFDLVFKEIESSLDNDTKNIIYDIITNIKEFNTNSKLIEGVNIFSQRMTYSKNNQICIPIGMQDSYLPSCDVNEITYTGFPYNEYFEKYLSKSVNEYFIPKIKILCWPIEGKATYNYIYSRLCAGYFTDLLHEDTLLPNEILLKEEPDWEKEIKDYFERIELQENKEIIDSDGLDYNILGFSKLKFTGYSSNNNSANDLEECNIIDFSDGSFMFLPKDSKILSEVENNAGKHVYKKCCFKELHIGARIFRYVKDRKTNLKIAAKIPEVSTKWNELDIWRTALEGLLNSHNQDYDLLSQTLQQCSINNSLNSNPTKLNIKRWVESEMIMPDKSNVRTILIANGDSDIDEKLSLMLNAFSVVNSFLISLSSKIKGAIISHLKFTKSYESEFTISVLEEKIEVESRTVSNLIEANEYIPYHSTRKILK